MTTEGRQQSIARELGVGRDFDEPVEVERRVAFLDDLLTSSTASALVLGISGGVDSAVAGMLCSLAVRSRPAGTVSFVAMRLPYGQQQDDADAQMVLDSVRPDRVLVVDVAAASDALLAGVSEAGLKFSGPAQRDYVLGNVKARQRMIAQYAVAGTLNGLVIGTDHAAEGLTGFFTKYGDGGVDANPLAGLTKRRVRALAAHLGLPERIVNKTPTADLETLRPQLPDEEALGVTYQQIDDFLEGLPVDPTVHDALVSRYAATAHKRATPAVPAVPSPT